VSGKRALHIVHILVPEEGGRGGKKGFPPAAMDSNAKRRRSGIDAPALLGWRSGKTTNSELHRRLETKEGKKCVEARAFLMIRKGERKWSSRIVAGEERFAVLCKKRKKGDPISCKRNAKPS